MRSTLKILAVVAILAGAAGLRAQQMTNPISQIRWNIMTGDGPPTATCQGTTPPPANSAAPGQLYFDNQPPNSVSECLNVSGSFRWVKNPVLTQFGVGAPPNSSCTGSANGAVYVNRPAQTFYICDSTNSAWLGPFNATGPVGPPGPPGSPANVTVIQCVGVNDAPGITAALVPGAHVIVSDLVAPCKATQHITIASSHVWLDFGTSTYTFDPGGNYDSAIQTDQQPINRTFTDAVLTAGIATITSATAAFTQSDVGRSITCVGGIGPGDSTDGKPSSEDIFTDVSMFVSATAIKLLDAPQASLTTTCTIRPRLVDITISGGSLIQKGPNVNPNGNLPSAYPAIAIIGVNGVTIRDMRVVNNSYTDPTSYAGGKEVVVQDVADFNISNITVHAWQLVQDGIDVFGPAHRGVIRHIRGHSGDDFVAILNNPQNAGLPARNNDTDPQLHGAIGPILIEDIMGFSTSGDCGVKLHAQSGTYQPLHDVTVRQVYGQQNVRGTIAFGNGVCNYGVLENIVIDGVGGSISTGVSVGDYNGLNILQARDMTVKNLAQNFLSFAGLFPSTAGFSMTGNGYIKNLDISGIQSQDYNWVSDVLLSSTGTVGTLSIHDIMHSNLTGGNYALFKLQGTVGSAYISNVNVTFNSATASAGVVLTNGATAGNAIIGNLALHHVYVTQASGAASSGPMVNITAGNNNSFSQIGNLVIDDAQMNSAVANSSYLVQLLTSASQPNTLGTFQLSNIVLNNQRGCYNNLGGIGTGTLNNITANIQFPNTCTETRYAATTSGMQVNGLTTHYGPVNMLGFTRPGLGSLTVSGSGGTGGLLDNTSYFYVISAVNAVGQYPSLESNKTACPIASFPSGCGNLGTITIPLGWQQGQISWNIYRGLTTGTELFCANVPAIPTGPLITNWVDTGLPCTGAAPPAQGLNTTIPLITGLTKGNGTAPTITWGTGAGSTAPTAVTQTGNQHSFNVAFTTPSVSFAPVASATLMTLPISLPDVGCPTNIEFSAMNAATGVQTPSMVWTCTGSTITITTGPTAFTASTAYKLGVTLIY